MRSRPTTASSAEVIAAGQTDIPVELRWTLPSRLNVTACGGAADRLSGDREWTNVTARRGPAPAPAPERRRERAPGAPVRAWFAPGRRSPGRGRASRLPRPARTPCTGAWSGAGPVIVAHRCLPLVNYSGARHRHDRAGCRQRQLTIALLCTPWPRSRLARRIRRLRRACGGFPAGRSRWAAMPSIRRRGRCTR